MQICNWSSHPYDGSKVAKYSNNNPKHVKEEPLKVVVVSPYIFLQFDPF